MKAALPSACAAFLISAAVAGAATLGVSAPALSGGNEPISACDPDGVTATYTTSAGNVTAVTVGGIADPGCEGASLSLAVTDASGASIAGAVGQTVPSDADTLDNSVFVSVSPKPLAEAPTAVKIVIAGP